MSQPPTEIRFRKPNGDLSYVTKRQGIYRCTCWDFSHHGFCHHVRETINENYELKDVIVDLPTFAETHESVREYVRLRNLAFERGKEISWLDKWRYIEGDAFYGKAFNVPNLPNGATCRTSQIVEWNFEFDAAVNAEGRLWIFGDKLIVV